MTPFPTQSGEAAPGAPSPPQPATVSGRSAVIALVVVLVAAFMELLDATIVSVAAPVIARDLAASEAAVQWMVAGYTLALGAGLITGGRVGDQFGRRRVFLLGLASFALASAACAFAANPATLICTRVAQGVAGGLMVPQVFGIIRSVFPPAARARAFGAYGAVLGLASVAGPLLGGLLVEADVFGLGWRTIFWINVPIALIGLVLGARVLPESSTSDRTRLDLPGAALAAALAVLVLLPLVQGRDWGWPWWGFALLALAVPTGALFWWRERNLVAGGGQPILDPALLRVRAFSGGLAASGLFFGALGSFFLMLSLYLQWGTGRSAWQTGLVILPYAIGSIITSGIGVQFAARAGRTLLISGALVLAASQVHLLLVVRSGAEPSYWQLAAPLFIGGLGLGLTAPSLMNVVLAGVPAKDAGAAGGVLTTVGQLGNSLGVAALGVLFFAELDASFGDGAPPHAAYGDALTAVLPWQVACYLAAAALMLLLPKAAKPD
ncbi:MFS transporter [Streptomyces zagrosensis]|uniref:EmrB/QacA subfamily drug resistance transporter n=1 Tax=Streptomyces zagrosensis TaxID=1042984 RepID=A0A7W9QHT6_9ACTN|nr:MFS transporter [Streptomyces zagrosensis]MBB5939928.1 EmrB/QacA subfamily drug resistance transporter [Streptomyces zagrosensis]